MTKSKQVQQSFFYSATVLALALLYFFKDARLPGFFPPCPFHSLTGFYCPGCGSQRAVSALLHGGFLQALHFNLLLVASLPLLSHSAWVSLTNTFRQQQTRQRFFYSPVFAKILLVVVILFWMLRNISGYPFNLLSPDF